MAPVLCLTRADAFAVYVHKSRLSKVNSRPNEPKRRAVPRRSLEGFCPDGQPFILNLYCLNSSLLLSTTYGGRLRESCICKPVNGDRVFVMSNRVAVLGGGVAGLSAAHELIERGFDVTVYERNDVFGGKARSLSVANTGTDGR